MARQLSNVLPVRFLAILARIGLVISLDIQSLFAQTSPKPEVLLDTILVDLTKGMTPGIAVLVARNGEILFNKGYGFASLEHRVPVTSETKFRIGSVSKQFTAAAILRLQEEHKLDVHDPLSKFIPDYPRGKEVTIHHLLTHTSGIHDYIAKPDFLKSVTLGVKPEDWIQSFKNDPYDFDPGTKWAYCSSGYFLLGYIIEKVSGKTYAEYLKDQLFDPLEMRATGVHTPTAIIENEAFGYSYEGNMLQKALNWDMSKGGGAGSLYSTVNDLYLWNERLFAGKVLREDSLKALLTPVRTGSQPLDQNGYGYGVGIGKLRGLAVIAAGGGLDGFAGHLARFPTETVTIVALSNVSALPGKSLYALAGDIAQIYLSQKMESR